MILYKNINIWKYDISLSTIASDLEYKVLQYIQVINKAKQHKLWFYSTSPTGSNFFAKI